ALECLFSGAETGGLRRLYYDRVFRSRDRKRRQAVLHLAQVGRFPRAVGQRGTGISQGRVPIGVFRTAPRERCRLILALRTATARTHFRFSVGALASILFT